MHFAACPGVTCFRLHMYALMGCLAVLAVTSGGCRWAAPESRVRAIDPDTADRETLEQEYERLLELNSRLEAEREQCEKELAGRTIELENERESRRLVRAELDATLTDLQYLESQFLTLERRLGQEESKASAVAAVADAQLLYGKFRQEHRQLLTREERAEVDRRLAAADEAIGLGQFTAAVYHAHRAIRLLNLSERERQSFLSAGTPRVVSVAVANYREGPGTEYGVVGQLPRGTVVVELAQSDEWMQVKMRSGATGWVHASLIR